MSEPFRFSAFAPATLVRARRAADEQAFLHVEPPAGFRDAHARAGQFCKMRIGGDEGIFAMATAPGEEDLRFLVRTGAPAGGEAADRLAAAPDGTAIESTLPAGRGFELELARGRDVWLVATGTGIAPVRAALEVMLRERDAYGAIELVHGVRSPAHVALEEDMERWRAASVAITIALSDFAQGGTIAGETVQDILRVRGVDLSHASLVAVGHPEMLASLAQLAQERGLPEDRLLLNV